MFRILCGNEILRLRSSNCAPRSSAGSGGSSRDGAAGVDTSSAGRGGVPSGWGAELLHLFSPGLSLPCPICLQDVIAKQKSVSIHPSEEKSVSDHLSGENELPAAIPKGVRKPIVAPKMVGFGFCHRFVHQKRCRDPFCCKESRHLFCRRVKKRLLTPFLSGMTAFPPPMRTRDPRRHGRHS